MLNNLMERLRANPLALGLVGAGAVLGLGGLGWLAREVTARSETASRPSLLQLLEQVTQPATTPRQPQPRRPAPLPPPRPAWVSPLGRECLDRDPRLRQRLEAELAALPARRQRIPIDPSNYGVRFERDAFGHAIDPTPQVVVLHETVYGVGSALRTFQTPHPRDEDQVSYHTLIGGDGQVIDVLDPEQRAFGAGNSAFNGRWVVTNPRVGGSVNNFALHISLETPLDGEDNDPGHSGYSARQYDALALVLTDWMRRFAIPAAHITTHRQVDLGGERADPRSFDWQALKRRLGALSQLC
ncbi:N-acetylmuramoyl-L-alanine amidase [Synechococcus sp. BSF8S]|uniref:peptidoglycan recognition protein family protein n=1 Tax=Synechococcales TaxID=1890424 RepID=UPI001625F2E3|nr:MULTISPECIES: peptidoglycan recognition family protein [unclassified Synechococcus]MBC1260211.1 N-acetylmuramoyl-L-alanine amidase [Synechococcus sp. BSF8S]MBC1262972.1 N-acetylmuramoyl-L-alanine amidase [Synechococcus sp. BSA11S]